MTRYLRKGRERERENAGLRRIVWCGPDVVGLYRKDTIRGDLILAPVYEYERRMRGAGANVR